MIRKGVGSELVKLVMRHPRNDDSVVDVVVSIAVVGIAHLLKDLSMQAKVFGQDRSLGGCNPFLHHPEGSDVEGLAVFGIELRWRCRALVDGFEGVTLLFP